MKTRAKQITDQIWSLLRPMYQEDQPWRICYNDQWDEPVFSWADIWDPSIALTPRQAKKLIYDKVEEKLSNDQPILIVHQPDNQLISIERDEVILEPDWKDTFHADIEGFPEIFIGWD